MPLGETTLDLLRTVGLMVGSSALLLLLTRRLAIPSLVVFLAAGLLLGPVTGWIDLTAAFSGAEKAPWQVNLAWMTELGIALLLFLVGLELSLDKIRDVGPVAVAAGLGQVVFTALIGFFLALALGFTSVESFFLATALTFSSTVVVVKLLGQKGDIDALYGRIAIGIFLVQDLVVIFALTFLAGLSRDGGQGELGKNLMSSFGGLALLLVVVLWAGKSLLPRPFQWAARSPDTLLLWGLSWCLLLLLAAEVLHLSPEIGAFLAGISLAQLPCARDLHHRLQPLMNFFIALFFVTLGAQMQLGEARQQLGPALVLALFVLLGNPLIFMVILSRFGYSELTCFRTSITVAQISEFSFVFASMGLTSGLIGKSILAVVAVVGLVTIALSAYMILYSDPLYRFCRGLGILKVFGAAQVEDEVPALEFQQHVVVIGMNALGQGLSRALHERGLQVLAIDTDPAKLENLPCPTLLGNVEYFSVLQEASFEHSQLVISALQIEEVNTLVAYRCQQAGVKCLIHIWDSGFHSHLKGLGVAGTLDSRAAGGRRLQQKLDALLEQP